MRNQREFKEHDLRSDLGIVIATSLFSMWTEVPHQEVPLWERDVARGYVRKRLSKKFAELHWSRPIDDLIEIVGSLALGLAQSTAYIRNSTASIEDYIQLFRTRARKPLEMTMLKSIPEHESEKTIHSTCYMLFELLMERSSKSARWKAALELLFAMALLDVSGVDRDLLSAVFSRLFGDDARVG